MLADTAETLPAGVGERCWSRGQCWHTAETLPARVGERCWSRGQC